jgi:hypothetical protein
LCLVHGQLQFGYGISPFAEYVGQFHTLRLGESLDASNAAVVALLEQARAVLIQQTSDPVAAQQLAWQALKSMRQQQEIGILLISMSF